MKRYNRYYESKISFKGSCDRVRRTSEGENFWQDMMVNKKEVKEKEFLKNVDVSSVLDEDETWENYKYEKIREGDPIRFYKSTNGTYFFQTSGFEFIWC